MHQPHTVNTPQAKNIYTLGGIAAILMVSIILLQLIVFITVPPPLEGTVTDWFRLFQQKPFIGLLDFEFLMIVYTLISLPLAFALYFALKESDPPLMGIVLALSIIGCGAFIAARPVFEMLYLSNQYAAATSEAQRAVYLAAGETLVSTFHGTAFYVSYVLGSISGLILSVVMLKSHIFSRATAYMRIGSSVFDFGLFLPVVGTYLSIFSILLLMTWDFMVARRLFQLSQIGEKQFLPAHERT